MFAPCVSHLADNIFILKSIMQFREVNIWMCAAFFFKYQQICTLHSKLESLTLNFFPKENEMQINGPLAGRLMLLIQAVFPSA